MPLPTNPNAENSPAAGSLGRRQIIAGAAWTIPVIAAATAAPFAAASPECPDISQAAGWSHTTTSGTLRVNSNPQYNNRFAGTLYALPTNNANSFLSIQDNVAGPLTASVNVSRTFTPVADTTYTFSFTTSSTNNLTTFQTMQVHIGGVAQWTAATKASAGAANTLGGVATHTVTWTAPSNAVTTFAYRFFLPVTSGDNDDIRVSLPTITSPSCR